MVKTFFKKIAILIASIVKQVKYSTKKNQKKLIQLMINLLKLLVTTLFTLFLTDQISIYDVMDWLYDLLSNDLGLFFDRGDAYAWEHLFSHILSRIQANSGLFYAFLVSLAELLRRFGRQTVSDWLQNRYGLTYGQAEDLIDAAENL
jgi:preprotein translocase subunit SecY